MSGKGDTYRTVDGSKYRDSYDAIFGEKEREDEGRVGYFDVDAQEWVEDRVEVRAVRTGSPWYKDCVSNSAAVHPLQVHAFNAISKSNGTGEIYDPKGRPHFTSQKHQNKVLRGRGMTNLDSFG